MSDFEMRDIHVDYAHYSDPLDAEVDLGRHTSDDLLIQDSRASVQQYVDRLTDSLPDHSFDRIALPNPSVEIRDSPVLMDWIELLESKHDFKRIVIAEPVNRYQKSARSVLMHYFPELDVEFEILPDEEAEPARKIVVHCADPRFQAAFSGRIESLGLENYHRFAFAGASLALRETSVLRWVAAPINDGGIEEVNLIDHTDCAVAGGLSAHHNYERDEAADHARALSAASYKIQVLSPHQPPRVAEHLVGVQGIWDVEALKQQLKEEEEDA